MASRLRPPRGSTIDRGEDEDEDHFDGGELDTMQMGIDSAGLVELFVGQAAAREVLSQEELGVDGGEGWMKGWWAENAEEDESETEGESEEGKEGDGGMWREGDSGGEEVEGGGESSLTGPADTDIGAGTGKNGPSPSPVPALAPAAMVPQAETSTVPKRSYRQENSAWRTERDSPRAAAAAAATAPNPYPQEAIQQAPTSPSAGEDRAESADSDDSISTTKLWSAAAAAAPRPKWRVPDWRSPDLSHVRPPYTPQKRDFADDGSIKGPYFDGSDTGCGRQEEGTVSPAGASGVMEEGRGRRRNDGSPPVKRARRVRDFSEPDLSPMRNVVESKLGVRDEEEDRGKRSALSSRRIGDDVVAGERELERARVRAPSVIIIDSSDDGEKRVRGASSSSVIRETPPPPPPPSLPPSAPPWTTYLNGASTPTSSPPPIITEANPKTTPDTISVVPLCHLFTTTDNDDQPKPTSPNIPPPPDLFNNDPTTSQHQQPQPEEPPSSTQSSSTIRVDSVELVPVCVATGAALSWKERESRRRGATSEGRDEEEHEFFEGDDDGSDSYFDSNSDSASDVEPAEEVEGDDGAAAAAAAAKQSKQSKAEAEAETDHEGAREPQEGGGEAASRYNLRAARTQPLYHLPTLFKLRRSPTPPLTPPQSRRSERRSSNAPLSPPASPSKIRKRESKPKPKPKPRPTSNPNPSTSHPPHPHTHRKRAQQTPSPSSHAHPHSNPPPPPPSNHQTNHHRTQPQPHQPFPPLRLSSPLSLERIVHETLEVRRRQRRRRRKEQQQQQRGRAWWEDGWEWGVRGRGRDGGEGGGGGMMMMGEEEAAVGYF